MNNGFIKLHRKILENPIIMKDADYLALWIYLLLEATHKENDKIFKGKRITLKAGQLITGRNIISEKLKVNSSKVQRILDDFENEQQIEQQMSNRNRLISILKWNDYQKSEQQMNNKRTSGEHLVNTLQEYKEYKEKENISKDISKKDTYGFLNNVKLSKDEYEKLKEQFSDYEKKIDNLSGYIASKGDKYKSHYLTILAWARKDEDTKPPTTTIRSEITEGGVRFY